MKKLLPWLLALGVAALCGCQPQVPAETPVEPMPMAEEPAAVSNLAGTIKLDGSSTVFPISEAVAEEFRKVHSAVDVTVGMSGTGGGFKKFATGETDLNDASRPIKEKEATAAKEGGVEYVELPVAFDGLSVMVNPANDWVEHLTVDELKRIWEPESKVKSWKEIRPGFPDVELKLYGPGTDSGTFDYFTDAICGKEGASRSDFTPSEDDNVLVQGIAGDKGALGYFGYAYYVENQDKLKLVSIQSGEGEPIAPSDETINNGTYQPLGRPVFIYVSVKAAERPEVAEFVKFYLQNAPTLVKEVGYVPLPAKAYELALARFETRTTGSVFSGGSQIGVKIEDLLAAEGGAATTAPPAE